MIQTLTQDAEHNNSYGKLMSGVISSEKQDALLLEMVTDSGASATGPATGTHTYNVNLPLAFFTQSTYCPAGFVSGSPITIQLQLEKAITALTEIGGFTGLSYTMTEVQFFAQCLSFSSETTAVYRSLLESVGGTQSHGVSLMQVGQNNIPGGVQGIQTFQMPIRYRSLRAILTGMYDSGDQQNQSAFSITNRVARQLTHYAFTIAGLRIPIANVNISSQGQAEAVSELLKIAGTVDSRHQASMLTYDYGVPTAEEGTLAANAFYPIQDGDDNRCSFIMGLSTKSFGADPSVEDGLDLSSQTSNTIVEMRVKTPTSSHTSLHTYALVDTIFTFLSSGVITSSQ